MSRSPSMPPELSVVVPSVTGDESLFHALDALERQEGVERLEIIVPERCGPSIRDRVRSRYPRVCLLEMATDATIPEMRHRAFEVATAPSVAVIEDHVLVSPDWSVRLLEARRSGHPVVGGSVKNGATERLVDRAAYLCEYGHLLSPQPRGAVPWLTGNNVVYDRGLLEKFEPVLAEGAWEDRLHEAMRSSGIPLESRPEVEVVHRLHHSVRSYAEQRYLYSRAWAGKRVEGAPWPARLVAAGRSLLLPPVLLARIVRNAWPHPDHRPDVIRSLPLLVVFVLAWALGEVVGSVAGAGDAMSRVR